MWRWATARARLWPKMHPQRHITPNATEEIKLDGYRAIGVKTNREAIPRTYRDLSRNS
jgi:hypothetical protein